MVGGLPEGLSQDEFFEGFSVPRNKEIMRIYKDFDLLKQLGSGVPRILESYGKECFKFSDNFLRMTFPIELSGEKQITEQVDNLLAVLEDKTYSTMEIMPLLNLKHRPTFFYNYLQPSIELGLIEMTIPDKPKSSKQRYKLSEKGAVVKQTKRIGN